MNTDTFRAQLIDEKATLERELGTVGRPNPSHPGDWEAVPSETEIEADPNDKADQMEDFGNNNAILSDLEPRLANVNAALARIEDGSYGTCEVCSNPIEEERLQADPAAPTCKAHIEG